jgi:ABC-type multidrug transport system ATPase subunit
LLSTHLLQEVEALCDRVIILDQGTLRLDDALPKAGRESVEHLFAEITGKDRGKNDRDVHEVTPDTASNEANDE